MKKLVLVVWLSVNGVSFAQQLGDTSFHPKVDNPLYEVGEGPVVFLDEAHHNFHTAEGRYAPFVRVLLADGFTVRPNTIPFSANTLQSCHLLVIANALHASNVSSWTLPTPSAFSPQEITAVSEWVKQGGSLFLIADHMPFGGAASDLASVFGFQLMNGFAMQPGGADDLFTVSSNRLLNDSLTNGLMQVQSFTGQAFTSPPDARSLLQLDSAFTMYLPHTAWDFENDCSIESAAGLTQLAVMHFGKGRVVVSGEAAMFTAQIAGGQQVGLTAPGATDNLELLRRLMGWLSRR